MKNILFLSLIAFVSSCGGNCTKETCTTDPKCRCWCSVKCGYRDKKDGDQPVYIEKDPQGIGCYCNQWDADHYEDNCINMKGLEEK